MRIRFNKPDYYSGEKTAAFSSLSDFKNVPSIRTWLRMGGKAYVDRRYAQRPVVVVIEHEFWIVGFLDEQDFMAIPSWCPEPGQHYRL